MGTDGPGAKYSGVGEGSWERGVYDYRALPLPGSYVMRDEHKKASWTYDYQTREMVSFDSEEVAQWKGQYIRQHGLAGAMYWELSGDKSGDGTQRGEGGKGKDVQPGHSLVAVVKHAMGGLEMNEYNWLQYNRSKFPNMRNGM